MEIRTYKRQDLGDILEIFDSNCPKYFDSSDRSDLIDFLDKNADNNYKVVLLEKKVIGCGGHYIKHSDKLFGIAWVMFKRYSLGQKSFTKTTEDFFKHILAQIEKEKFDYDIVINTTQLLENTFIKFGFITEQIIQNGFGDNLDHYKMRRRTTNPQPS
jgi:predicted GNAT family N-acyltransferase